jgi:nicotinic acid mononucleotide adenylyltransferase
LAHLELAASASVQVEEILFVVPEYLPHKEQCGATLEQRIDMLLAFGCVQPHSIAVSSGGLFVDIARECRELYGPSTQFYFVCGRDAAERVLGWDYGRPGVVEGMLRDFELLVAPRLGEFTPPERFRHRIHPLAMTARHDAVSSSDIRQRMAARQPWEHLVPENIVQLVREIYS